MFIFSDVTFTVDGAEASIEASEFCLSIMLFSEGETFDRDEKAGAAVVAVGFQGFGVTPVVLTF